MRKIKIISAAILVVLLIYPGSFISYWFLRGIFDPSYGIKIYREYQELPSKILIKKLYTIDPVGPLPSEAMMELARRRDKSATTHIIKYLNSWNKYRRRNAIRALGEIGDKSSIPALMIIVKKNEHTRNRDYELALEALSKMQYEEAYPYIVELAEKNDISSVDMLSNFSKPESIKLLEKIKQYYNSDSLRDQLYVDKIDEAIQKIKEQQ